MTARDTGTYGRWNEFWLQDDSPYSFLIVQAVMTADGHIFGYGKEGNDFDRQWNEYLKRARAKGIRVIADLGKVKEDQSLDLENLPKAMDEFTRIVNKDDIYAITLSEENVFWGGHADLLKNAYYAIKKKYDVPVYQWYSPRQHAPGFGAWPQLPADGWTVDEYARLAPDFEKLMRGFSAHQLPVVQIVWASPAMRTFNWDEAGEPAFDYQLNICRKYNIPAAFFMWEGPGGSWGWDPAALPPTKKVYRRTVDWAEQSSQMDLRTYAGQWDDYQALQPLSFSYAADGSVTYGEDFMTRGGLTATGGVRKGFRDVRWDGGPLDFRPREKGQASAVLQYPLHSEIPLRDLKIVVNGRSEPKLKGVISVAASTDGRSWTAPKNFTGEGPFTLSLAGDPRFQNCTDFVLRMTLSGQAGKVGDVPASIKDYRVTGTIQRPVAKEVSIQTLPGVTTRWEMVPSGSQLFTAEIDNPEAFTASQSFIGLLGKPGGNKVTIRQKFVCPAGIDLRRITTKNYADEKNYGSVNSIGLSLDGKDVLIEKSSAGIDDNQPTFSIEVPDEARFKNVKEFWLHLTMRTDAGQHTANEIRNILIEGVGHQPATVAAVAP